MKREIELEVTGTVVDLAPNRLYRVRLHNGGVVTAHVESRLRMQIVRLIPGEQVLVRLSDVDSLRGRIIRRLSADGEKKR